MPHDKTIAALSQPRIWQAPTAPRAPLTADEKKKKHEDSAETQRQIDEAMGGTCMVNHHEKVNPYNAFKSKKAAQIREEDLEGKNAPALHEEYFKEYFEWTPEEKAELVARFTESKEDAAKLQRDSPRAHMQDVSNTSRNIQKMLHGLSYHVGVEAFFCIVRNTTDFHMAPQWYFTSKELEHYMPLAVRKKWDTGEAGMRIEAFAVAGCDTANLLRKSKDKCDFLKAEICQGIYFVGS
ncbi:hypothetical protein DFH09DRAFT_1321712 [Mycena vulgaris]|nr:hypothetical protein DFH09DRAFT_1321712 [Mycena vulgaris]